MRHILQRSINNTALFLIGCCCGNNVYWTVDQTKYTGYLPTYAMNLRNFTHIRYESKEQPLYECCRHRCLSFLRLLRRT